MRCRRPRPGRPHGPRHDHWHEGFYSKLIRKDTKTSCCNLADCRPTSVRMVADWAGYVLVAYFGGRSIEKVAQILKR
jgi:hypothetical protein